ncbi:hypothetical protein [Rhodococcus sp. HNM0569]|uniref:hypothetical protein n=1 Tax=Rhodococcus sp. HNM0569 TaxID=2716340 RepID=UPI00146A9394|nr:hypothetical protein [Rhodococcus sp. HNM0569]NLU82029.1 hypothetical protein [Rhodococcus sp. HNM0569]
MTPDLTTLPASDAAASQTGPETIVAYVALGLLFAGLGLFPFFHRWKVRYGRRTAPPADEQKHRIARQCDGRDVFTVDPRMYTITVVEMNAVANSHGYYYIGEKGYTFGSVEVAFQRLPAPPLPRLPSLHNTWSRYPHA